MILGILPLLIPQVMPGTPTFLAAAAAPNLKAPSAATLAAPAASKLKG